MLVKYKGRRSMNSMHVSVLLVLLLFLFSACGGDAEPEAEAELETATVEPTAVPATATAPPTPTVAPTATATTSAPAPLAPEIAGSCASPEVAALMSQLQVALAHEDEAALAGLIHPEKGLTVRMAWWNPAVHFSGGSLLSDETSHDWGTEDGSGFAITGSFDEVVLPFLQQDLVEATEVGCDEILSGATAGLVQLPPEDEGLRYVSLYRPAPAGEIEFDWGSWVAGYEEWQGELYLTTLIHYVYEI
jgi:hypothetical protein